jgi:hypothetical protein
MTGFRLLPYIFVNSLWKNVINKTVRLIIKYGRKKHNRQQDRVSTTDAPRCLSVSSRVCHLPWKFSRLTRKSYIHRKYLTDGDKHFSDCNTTHGIYVFA